jgi:hypothetical protein
VADTPATNVTVLSFEVQITGAVLQPGSVAILPRPVTVDLAQLVSDTGFLASTVIDSTTYTSLEITFANPQVTILNNTEAPIALPGQSCAAGATCTFTPALNNASVTISSGVFPLTLTASSTTGLNLDLSIPDLLQSDLSVTLANGTSVNLSLLSGQSATSQQASIDDVMGTITAISGSQVSVTTAFVVGPTVYPAVSGASFASTADLLPGQELILSVGSDLVAGTTPSFSTGSVYLEASQLVGEVSSVDTGDSSLEMDGLSGLLTGARPLIQQVNVQTGSSTTFVGFPSSSLAAVTTGQFIAAKGPLLNTTDGGFPTVGAIDLRERASGSE